MSALLISYARVSTDGQNLTAQRDAFGNLRVGSERVYVDHSLTGANRDRRGLREPLVACRQGDTLVGTKLGRLARSVTDARAIAAELIGVVLVDLLASASGTAGPAHRQRVLTGLEVRR